MPVISVGDLNIAYERFGAGSAVLMINGIGADRTAWGLQIPAVSRDFSVITFDNRDVGQTGPGNDPRPYSMRQFADDAAGFLDGIDIESAHIVGASMGGAIAQELAIAYPEKTRSLTVVCSWPRSDPWMVELMSQWDDVFRMQGRVAWARMTWLWVFTYRYYQNPDNLRALVTGAESAPNPQSLEMYLRQSEAFKRHDALDRLGQIGVPAHVICGEEDIYTPLRYSIDLANEIPGARLSVMPEVGHGMFWETIDDFNRLVVDFLLEVERKEQ
jgi:3-oxoadipate enol-lactonase